MANQASAFNGCCSIYAPYYRQASIYSYYDTDEVREEIHAFVYQDVKKAFEYFIKNYSNGRPFIIASHSQGTHHSLDCLLRKLMELTYTLGWLELISLEARFLKLG